MRVSRRSVWFGSGLLLLGLVGGLFWYGNSRIRNLESQLSGTEDRLTQAGQALDRYSRELADARKSADAAREQAASAEEHARATSEEAARRTGESETARLQAESEAERARRQAELAQREAADLRQRREQELERMQKALSRIAPTRRTPMGLIVELGSDSLRFDFDKADLRAENRELLSRIAGVLLASEGYRIFVYGHTDDIGAEDYNEDLSERRAGSVAHYLLDAGIPPELISQKGFGKSSPLSTERTRAAREKNRRVEIGVIDTMITYDMKAIKAPTTQD